MWTRRRFQTISMVATLQRLAAALDDSSEEIGIVERVDPGEVAAVARKYARFGVDILKEARRAGRYVLSELADGRRPYTVVEGLQETEAKLGKYAHGKTYVDGWAHRTPGLNANVGTHEEIHRRIDSYGLQDKIPEEDEERDVRVLTTYALMMNAADQDAVIAEMAVDAYNVIPNDGELGAYLSGGNVRYQAGAGGPKDPMDMVIEAAAAPFKNAEKGARKIVNGALQSYTGMSISEEPEGVGFFEGLSKAMYHRHKQKKAEEAQAASEAAKAASERAREAHKEAVRRAELLEKRQWTVQDARDRTARELRKLRLTERNKREGEERRHEYRMREENARRSRRTQPQEPRGRRARRAPQREGEVDSVPEHERIGALYELHDRPGEEPNYGYLMGRNRTPDGRNEMIFFVKSPHSEPGTGEAIVRVDPDDAHYERLGENTEHWTDFLRRYRLFDEESER